MKFRIITKIMVVTVGFSLCNRLGYVGTFHSFTNTFMRNISAFTLLTSRKWKPPFQSAPLLGHFRIARLSTSVSLNEEELNCPSQKKLLKVAIVGRPNAGKSTLINTILSLNVCGVAYKSHTTRTTFKAAFTRGDTQIIFVDTPGLVTKKEQSRFQLSDEFIEWKEKILEEIDIVGVVHDASHPQKIFTLHLNLIQNLNEIFKSLPMFLVLNKIDLVIDKDEFTAVVDSYFGPKNLERPGSDKISKVVSRFSKVFFTSATQYKGVNEVENYLLQQAKPGEWVFDPGQVFDRPLHEIIIDLVRAQMLDILPQEIPYLCKYEIEYLKENDLGEILCVGLITCKHKRHMHLITSGKKGSLRAICQKLESDLYKILGRVFKIRLVVQV